MEDNKATFGHPRDKGSSDRKSAEHNTSSSSEPGPSAKRSGITALVSGFWILKRILEVILDTVDRAGFQRFEIPTITQ